MSLRLEEISKYYGKEKALDEITFEVGSGEVVGILGPNGAGKSTMMKIITGFMNPDKGKVFIDNEYFDGSDLQIKKRIGYLPENNPLYPDLFVKEYLSFAAGMYRLNDKKKRISEIIGVTGLGREQHKKIGALSKGYRQRVGIAQALIHDPSLLILDEPTSGLDPSQIVEIRQLIRSSCSNKTVLLSTHIMQEAEAVCDRIIILNRGRIVADDTPSSIKAMASAKTGKVYVEFKEQSSEEELVKIPGVKEAKLINEKTWSILSENPDIRSEIFRYAVSNGLTIIALTQEESTLENVFLEIVK